MALALRDSPRVTGILRKCYSHVEVADRDRNRGIGVTNLKRLFGRPDDLRVVVEALASTVGRADALASADTGGAPPAAVSAYQLGLPAVFIREVLKEHFLTYGADPATNHPRLAVVPADRAGDDGLAGHHRRRGDRRDHRDDDDAQAVTR